MRNNVRRFFRLSFFATIVLLCFVTAFSCSDLFSDITSTFVSNSNTGETITFTGTVRSTFSNGGAIPAEYAAQFAQAADGAESASASTAGRSAIPSLPNDTPTTTVTATATGESQITQNVTGNSFTLGLKSGKSWTVTVTRTYSGGITLSDSATFDLTSVQVTSHDFVLKPDSSGSGTIALGFSTPDSAFDSVTAVSVKKNNEDASSAWTNAVNCTTSGLSMKTNKTLAAGVYSVSLRFSKGAYSYTSIQEINVFTGLETNTWLVSNKDADGKFQVTQSMMSMSEIYVGSTASGIAASDVTGTGSPYKPYATIVKAVEVINDLPKRAIDEAPYVIRVKNGYSETLTRCISVKNNISIECWKNSLNDKEGTATLTRDVNNSMFSISSGSMLTIDGVSTGTDTWSGLILDGNKDNGKTGTGISIQSSGKLTLNGGTIKNCSITNGAGVYNSGMFVMNGGIISDNEASSSGGGVYINSSATFTMTDGIIKENSANDGGGISVYGYSQNNVQYVGVLIMKGGTISGNSANNGGGGVHSQNGTIYMYGSAIIGDINADAPATDSDCSNKAKKGSGIMTEGLYPKLYIGYKEPAEGQTTPTLDNDFNGGIYHNFATETNQNNSERGGAIFVKCPTKIANCKIKFNGSASDGGGIFAYSDSLDIKNTEISGNSAVRGGGLYVSSPCELSDGTVISGNTATSYGSGVFLIGSNLSINGSAYIDSSSTSRNDIYFGSPSTKITISGALNPPPAAAGITATITPYSYSTNKAVLIGSGGAISKEYSKFAVTPKTGNDWQLKFNGCLIDGADTTVEMLEQYNDNGVDITDSSKVYVIQGQGSENPNSAQVNIGHNASESSTYNITLDNVYRIAQAWEAGFSVFNNYNTPLTVNITLLGKNSIEGYNHGGIKLSSESNSIYNDNAVINLVFDTPSTGTFRFDSFEDKDIQVEHATANFSIASGCTFTGTVGTQSYTNPDEFFAAAQTSTIGSEFTITR